MGLIFIGGVTVVVGVVVDVLGVVAVVVVLVVLGVVVVEVVVVGVVVVVDVVVVGVVVVDVVVVGGSAKTAAADIIIIARITMDKILTNTNLRGDLPVIFPSCY